MPAIDLALRTWVVGHRVAVLDLPLLVLSVVGDWGLLWIAIAALMAARRRLRWRDVGRLVLAVVIAVTLTDHVLKPLFNRPRPFVVDPSAPVIGHRPDDGSFPSGHATAAFASAVTLSVVAPRLWVVWWSLAAVVAYSRIYLGVHYPLDVAA